MGLWFVVDLHATHALSLKSSHTYLVIFNLSVCRRRAIDDSHRNALDEPDGNKHADVIGLPRLCTSSAEHV